MQDRKDSDSRKLLQRLKGILGAPGGVQDRLDQITHHIADSMGTEVCSIYLFRDADTLELCATEGLRPEAVHQTRLRLGEGLVGRVARTGRNVNTANAPAQPGFRLARYGRWRRIDTVGAHAHPAFGPFGFMASLLIGMLLNVAVRSFEFLLAVPAMNHHAPAWGTTIFHMMAFDVIAMNFLYSVCFVMALRSIPLFPRTLLFAWLMDLFMQWFSSD